MKNCILLWSIFITACSTAQTHYYFSGSGNLNTLTNWGNNTNGTGTNPSSFTSAGDTFEIRNCSLATLQSNWSVNGTNSRIIVGDGTNFTRAVFDSGYAVNGMVIVKSNAELVLSHTSVPTIDSLFTGSKVVYKANGNQNLSNKSYYHLEIYGSGSKLTVGDLTVNGNLHISGILDVNASTEDLIGNLQSVTGTGLLRTTSSGPNALPANLTWSCTVEFYRNGNQTIPYGNYSILMATGNSGTKSITGGTLQVDSILFISPACNMAMGSNKLTGNLSQIYGAGTLTTTCTETSPLPENRIWNISVTYSANSAGQYIVSGSYFQLLITSGTNTNIATGNLTILDNGLLQISSGNTLDMLSAKLVSGVELTIGGAGTIKTQNTSTEPIPNNKSWTQSMSYNASAPQYIMNGIYLAALNVNGGNRYFPENDTLKISGNFTASIANYYAMQNCLLVFQSLTIQTIATDNNLILPKVHFSGLGLKTIQGPLKIAGLMVIDSGVTVNLGNNIFTADSLYTAGGINALLRTQNTSNASLPANKTWNFRLQLDGTNQSLAAGWYQSGLQLLNGIKTMTGDIHVADTLSIFNGAELSITSHLLTLNGIIHPTQTGTITGSTSGKIIVGNNQADAGTLYMSQHTANSNTLAELTLSRNTGENALILGNKLVVTELLTLSDGMLNTNGNLVFGSSSVTHSAQIAPLIGTGNISGMVTVQRYIKGNNPSLFNRWRFVSSSVTTANFISNNWQKQMHITGPGTGGSACPNLSSHTNGFDPTLSNNASFYCYQNDSQRWESLSATNSIQLKTGKGYRVYYRGARSGGCALLTNNMAIPNDTVLQATGTLSTGQVIVDVGIDSGDFSLIGNPYQATIDWTSTGISKTNLCPTIYGWKHDASVSGAYSSYTTFPIPDSTLGMSRYMAPGSAFFVQTNAAGNGKVTFTEACKDIAQNGFAFFKTNNQQSVLRIQLSSADNNAIYDEVVFRVLKETCDGFVEKEDARKIGFGSRQIAIKNDASNDSYSICRVPEIYCGYGFRIDVNLPSESKSMALNFIAANSFSDSVEPVLYDLFTNQFINLAYNSIYKFQTTLDSNSFKGTRFKILFDWKQPVSNLLEPEGDQPTIQCYPNPVVHQLWVETPGAKNTNIRIYNENGQVVYTAETSNTKTAISFAEWIHGTYIVEVISNGKVMRKTFVKTNSL